MTTASDVPNPGSDAARDRGCRCPVMDNNRGKFPPWPDDGWWLHPKCPLHGFELADHGQREG